MSVPLPPRIAAQLTAIARDRTAAKRQWQQTMDPHLDRVLDTLLAQVRVADGDPAKLAALAVPDELVSTWSGDIAAWSNAVRATAAATAGVEVPADEALLAARAQVVADHLAAAARQQAALAAIDARAAAQEAARAVAGHVADQLQLTGSIFFTQTTAETRLAVAKLSSAQYLRWCILGEGCPLCATLDGQVIDVDSQAAEMLDPPLHPNCECMWIEIMGPELGNSYNVLDFNDLDPDLLARHGVLIPKPDGTRNFEALHVPADIGGRDFTFRRTRVDGEWKSSLEWHHPRYDLPGLSAETEHTGVAATAPRFATIGARGA
jgi:hypothetical protein